MRANSRVVIIVGASSGIGRATAHALARRGDAVVLASRSALALAEVAAECRALAPRTPQTPRSRRSRAGSRLAADPVLAVPADVRDRASLRALFEAATARYGAVDAVVHTAAVVGYGRFEDVPADVFDEVIAINLLGTANVARAAFESFAAGGGGHLVLTGSLLGKIATPWMSAYVTGKWGVHGLARTLRIEARTMPGVEVSLVSPGGVDTPIYAQAANYAGRVGRPPPPIDRPETVARAIVKVLDRPRRELSTGLVNGLWTAGFRFLPAVYDVLVAPGMSVLGLSRTPTGDTTGNVFEPVPHAEATHGRWGRHWLRGLAVAGAATAAALAAARLRRAGPR